MERKIIEQKIKIGNSHEYSKTSYYNVPFTFLIENDEYDGEVNIAIHSNDGFADIQEFLNFEWDKEPNLNVDDLSVLQDVIIEYVMRKW